MIKSLRLSLSLYILVLPLILDSCVTKSGEQSKQNGPTYLDPNTPGLKPRLFAPNLVNTDSVELNGVFNASMTEFFFTRIINGNFIIHHSELKDGSWTAPEALPLFPDGAGKSTAVDMTVTPDGATMYFLGIDPGEAIPNPSSDIYQSKKVNGEWQPATKVGPPISTDEYNESYPVVVSDGSLYFVSNRPGGKGKQDIYRAQYLGDGKFDKPVSLSAAVNTELGSGDTYVDPDESYLISNKRHPENPGLYVSFKEENEWQPLQYLGSPINSEWTDFCPYMSPDGKYFFFSRRYSDPPDSGWPGVVEGEVYWVDAEAIFRLRSDKK